ncbi:pro-FMRFamide-related neuropeptide VF [Halichoeres trimaculatus]|uniref:pro-FMRFamide-related neuropeptide VF n=1 Tax=Halichoeres trimaculatus TaxID=147232 RepID=UPI003D9F7F79
MSVTVFLSVLLVLGGLFGTVTTDPQVLGKSALGGRSLLSSDDGRHTVRKHLHQQGKSDFHRSLDPNSFKIQPTPTKSKISLPSIIKLYPPTPKPLHLHANMPMRFGRQMGSGNDKGQNPNMPQRFGRGWPTVHMCTECHKRQEQADVVLPQRFGRSSLKWRLYKTLIGDQLIKQPRAQEQRH